MIEETLFKSNYLGKDGFIWWLGQVAPPESWDIQDKIDINFKKYPDSWAYRCKVRIIGYHTFDRNILKDKDLPWAHIMLGNTDGNSQGGLGKTHKLIGGETVFGFFLDGDDAQQPVIVGTLYRNHNVENFDIDEIAFKPFSGSKSSGSRATYGLTKQPQVTSQQNLPDTQTDDEEDIFNGEMKSPVTSNFDIDGKTDLFLPFDQALSIAYARASAPIIVSENGCGNNTIGKITREIKNFIAIVSGLETGLNVYVNPALNTFVDINREITRTADLIMGSVKFLVNDMRDRIMKLVGLAFSKFVGLVVPIPQQPIVGEASKNLLNIIFCLFEKVISQLLPFLENMLKGLVGRAINAPLCAIEELSATLINKMIENIDSLLTPVMSGIDWLSGSISEISSLLSDANSIATQLFNLIGCDNLKCETPSEWSLAFGPKKSQYDNWNRVVDKMNFLKTSNDSIESSLSKLSIYGTNFPLYSDCSDRVRTPRSQEDLINTTSKYPIALPPEINIYGNGTGAQALPIIGKNGSILSIKILNSGFGYSDPPTVNIVDKSNHGNGARAQSVIRNGRVVSIYLTSNGSGYVNTGLSLNSIKPLYWVTADRYSLFEGEVCTFTVNTQNVNNGTKLKYIIGGDITQTDIVEPITDTFEIFDETNESIKKTSIKITLRQDSTREPLDRLFFDLHDNDDNKVARTIILVNDRTYPILQVSDEENIQSPPGTPLPEGFFTLSESTPTGLTTTGSGKIKDVIIKSPGIGYTLGDTINIGGCVYTPVLTSSGSIIGINTNILCPNIFDILPTATINTNTGIGAEIFPEISSEVPTDLVINEFGVIKVVDCI